MKKPHASELLTLEKCGFCSRKTSNLGNLFELVKYFSALTDNLLLRNDPISGRSFGGESIVVIRSPSESVFTPKERR